MQLSALPEVGGHGKIEVILEFGALIRSLSLFQDSS
jgi:hypothetical protein